MFLEGCWVKEFDQCLDQLDGQLEETVRAIQDFNVRSVQNFTDIAENSKGF